MGVVQLINWITMLSIVLTGAALMRERERGTVEHLLVLPVRPAEIMTAKVLANGMVIIVATALSLNLVVQGSWISPLPAPFHCSCWARQFIYFPARRGNILARGPLHAAIRAAGFSSLHADDFALRRDNTRPEHASVLCSISCSFRPRLILSVWHRRFFTAGPAST